MLLRVMCLLLLREAVSHGGFSSIWSFFVGLRWKFLVLA